MEESDLQLNNRLGHVLAAKGSKAVASQQLLRKRIKPCCMYDDHDHHSLLRRVRYFSTSCMYNEEQAQKI